MLVKKDLTLTAGGLMQWICQYHKKTGWYSLGTGAPPVNYKIAADGLAHCGGVAKASPSMSMISVHLCDPG